MKNITTEIITGDVLCERVQGVRKNDGRLVAINRYVDKDKRIVVIYTLEYENIRIHYHIRNENILPSITNIYRGYNGLKRKFKKLCL